MRLEGEVNVLLVGSGDPRHILKIVAGLQNKEILHVSLGLVWFQRTSQSYCAASKLLLFAQPQVWVIESSMELVARQLLLLYLALLPQESMGINGACFLFFYIRYYNCKCSVKIIKLNCWILFFREDRDFPGGVWEQWNPHSDRRDTEMCSVTALCLCYRNTGDTHTFLSEHDATEGTSIY